MCDLMIKGVGVSCAKVRTDFLNKLSLSKTRDILCVTYSERKRRHFYY